MSMSIYHHISRYCIINTLIIVDMTEGFSHVRFSREYVEDRDEAVLTSFSLLSAHLNDK